LVLLAAPGRNVWHTYRHTFALNEEPVDDQKDRLRRIFSGPPAAAVAVAHGRSCSGFLGGLTYDVMRNTLVP
jgi:hypothetical protein